MRLLFYLQNIYIFALFVRNTEYYESSHSKILTAFFMQSAHCMLLNYSNRFFAVKEFRIIFISLHSTIRGHFLTTPWSDALFHFLSSEMALNLKPYRVEQITAAVNSVISCLMNCASSASHRSAALHAFITEHTVFLTDLKASDSLFSDKNFTLLFYSFASRQFRHE